MRNSNDSSCTFKSGICVAQALLAVAIVAACGPQEQSVEQDQTAEQTATSEKSIMTTAPKATQQVYGHLSDGSEVSQVTLANANGMEVDIISYFRCICPPSKIIKSASCL